MGNRKVSILLISGERERLQMGAAMASAAAVSGFKVTVLLSMNALPHFTRKHDGIVSNEGRMGDLLLDRDDPSFVDLFERISGLGDAKVHPCSMAMDMLALRKHDMLSFVGDPLALDRFLHDAEDGQCWTL